MWDVVHERNPVLSCFLFCFLCVTALVERGVTKDAGTLEYFLDPV